MTAVREGWPQPRGRNRVELIKVRAGDLVVGDVVWAQGSRQWYALTEITPVGEEGSIRLTSGKLYSSVAYRLDPVTIQWLVPLYPHGMVDVDLPDYEPECCGSGSCEVCRPDLHEGRRGD